MYWRRATYLADTRSLDLELLSRVSVATQGVCIHAICRARYHFACIGSSPKCLLARGYCFGIGFRVHTEPLKPMAYTRMNWQKQLSRALEAAQSVCLHADIALE